MFRFVQIVPFPDRGVCRGFDEAFHLFPEGGVSVDPSPLQGDVESFGVAFIGASRMGLFLSSYFFHEADVAGCFFFLFSSRDVGEVFSAVYHAGVSAACFERQ